MTNNFDTEIGPGAVQ